MCSLYLIPEDPHYRPSKERIDRFFDYMVEEGILQRQEDTGTYVNAKEYKKFMAVSIQDRFILDIDPKSGERIERREHTEPSQGDIRVRVDIHEVPEHYYSSGVFHCTCPECRKIISAEAWKEAMIRWEKSGKQDLGFACPRCGVETNLNDLHYRPARRFGRFSISIDGIQAGCYNLEWGVLEEIEDILDCALREIADMERPAYPKPPPPKGVERPAAPETAKRASKEEAKQGKTPKAGAKKAKAPKSRKSRAKKGKTGKKRAP
jgi:hypothetical protein